MKKLFIILTFLPFLVFAQEKTAKNSPWAIDLIFSPDNYAPPQVAADASFNQESAYRLGMNVICDFDETSHWSFRSGLRYAIYKQKIVGFIISPLPFSANTYTSFKEINYFDLPLFLRYSIGKKRLRFYGEVGGSLDYIPNDGKKKIQPSWGLSLGLDYRFYAPFSIFAQPTFRKPFSENNNYYLSTGIEMGIKLRLPEY